MEGAYPISMPEPCRSLLLVAHERDPVVARMTEALPDIWVPVHPSHIPRLMERHTGRGTDPMCKGFIVPKGRVLEHQPAARFTDPAPAFTLVPMTSNPARSVKIAIKAKFLFMRLHFGVLWVHVFRRRRDLLLVKISVEAGRIGVFGVRSHAKIVGMRREAETVGHHVSVMTVQVVMRAMKIQGS